MDNNRLVNVYDFGAVGDGVTDDSAAFQRAVDAAAKGARERIERMPSQIVMRAGTYCWPLSPTITATLVFSDPVTQRDVELLLKYLAVAKEACEGETELPESDQN